MHKLTDFQTLKGNQFSLWYHSCIHNLQNKMHNFRINNEIPNDKICLCVQLLSFWVRTRVSVWVHVVHFVQIDAFTVFVFVLWCPLWFPGEYDIRLCYSHCVLSIFYLCFGKYLRQLMFDTMSKSDCSVLAVTPLLPP
jgi:hypothetical protein